MFIRQAYCNDWGQAVGRGYRYLKFKIQKTEIAKGFPRDNSIIIVSSRGKLSFSTRQFLFLFFFFAIFISWNFRYGPFPQRTNANVSNLHGERFFQNNKILKLLKKNLKVNSKNEKEKKKRLAKRFFLLFHFFHSLFSQILLFWKKLKRSPRSNDRRYDDWSSKKSWPYLIFFLKQQKNEKFDKKVEKNNNLLRNFIVFPFLQFLQIFNLSIFCSSKTRSY